MKVEDFAHFDILQAGEGDLLVDPLTANGHPRLLRVLDFIEYRHCRLLLVFNGEAEYWLANTKDGIVPFDSLDFARRELYHQRHSGPEEVPR